MNHINILKRAFSITWNYRVLWVFGFILAFSLPRSNPGSSSGWQYNKNDFSNWQGFPQITGLSATVVNSLIGIGIALICVLFMLAIAGTIARYVSETSLIRLVDQNETTGEKVKVRTGFRMGWIRQAFRLFLLDLFVGVLGSVGFILLFSVAAVPFLVWLTNNSILRTIGTVTGIGLVFLVILLLIVVVVVLSVVMQFIRRAIILENLGVIASIKRGFMLVRQRMSDIAIMALLMFAIGLGWVVLSIPILLILLLAGVVLGGLPALLVGWITSLFTQGSLPWILAGVVGLPIFLLVLIVPMGFVSGLMEVFKSSTWTLTYREVLALGNTQLEIQSPQPETSKNEPGEGS